MAGGRYKHDAHPDAFKVVERGGRFYVLGVSGVPTADSYLTRHAAGLAASAIRRAHRAGVSRPPPPPRPPGPTSPLPPIPPGFFAALDQPGGTPGGTPAPGPADDAEEAAAASAAATAAGFSQAFRRARGRARMGMGPDAAAFAGMAGSAGSASVASASPGGLPPLPAGWTAPRMYDRGRFANAFERAFDGVADKLVRGIGLAASSFRYAAATVRSAVAHPVRSAAAAAAMASSGWSSAARAASGWSSAMAARRGPAPAPGPAAARRAARNAARASSARWAARHRQLSGHYKRAIKAGASRAHARRYAAFRSSDALDNAGMVGAALQAVVKFGRDLKGLAEEKLAGNRGLAPYSARIGLGFAQLDLGDQTRNLRLARHAQDSALALARDVNSIREGDLGFDKLKSSINNRIGRIAAAVVGPGWRAVGDLAGQAADRIERADPAGAGVPGLINKVHDWAAGVVGFHLGLLSTGSLSEAAKWASETMKDLEKERRAGVVPVLDGWSQFIADARGLPAAPPARPVRP